MRRAVKLIVAGLIAFALSLLVFLPASLLTRWLPPGVTVGTLTGTVWNGASDSLQLGGEPLGAARWKVRPLQLFRGRLAVDTQIIRSPGGATARVLLSPGGDVHIENLDLRWPLADFPVRVSPPNWTGDVRMKLDELELAAGVIRRIVGTVEARDLVAAPNGVMVGSYRVTFDPASNSDKAIVGKLQDLDNGPMEVDGTITLAPDRSAVLQGRVKARPGAPPEITRPLENLRYQGPPDAQGRLPFSVENSY